jgi:hypothetical protein
LDFVGKTTQEEIIFIHWDSWVAVSSSNFSVDMASGALKKV